MNRSNRALLAPIIGMCLLLAGWTWSSVRPDWAALYEQQLGRPILELEEKFINAKAPIFGEVPTRIAEVAFKDGSSGVLGIPAHSRWASASQIVASTVLLPMADLRRQCVAIYGRETDNWSWSIPEKPTNIFKITPTPWKLQADGSKISSNEPGDPYCEFEFTGKTWRPILVDPIDPGKGRP